MTRAFRCKLCGAIVESDNYPPSMRETYLRLEDAKLCGTCWGHMNQICPECGEKKHYRIIYKDDEMTEVDFYDCMMCRCHWKPVTSDTNNTINVSDCRESITIESTNNNSGDIEK